MQRPISWDIQLAMTYLAARRSLRRVSGASPKALIVLVQLAQYLSLRY